MPIIIIIIIIIVVFVVVGVVVVHIILYTHLSIHTLDPHLSIHGQLALSVPETKSAQFIPRSWQRNRKRWKANSGE